jgi:threonine dehydrogenase-like Zn-dependent dehydrogenase
MTPPHLLPEARSLWLEEPGRASIRTTPLPDDTPGGVLVRTLFSGISRGTESLVFRGEIPPSQAAAMRAPFQEGDFPAPVKYGYCSVGVVEAGSGDLPEEDRRRLVGREVFCLHPHQDRYWVPAGAVTPLPPGVPADRAILAANLETALNAVWDASPGPGDRIRVVGGGVVGILIAWLCRDLPGCDLALIDPNSARETVARALGVPFQVRALNEEAGSADVVFHASGNPDGLVDALALAGQEALVLEASWFGAHPVPLPLGEAFHSHRLRIQSSQVGRIPPHRAPRWNFARRMGTVVQLLRAPELDALISGESAFEDLPETLARLSLRGEDALCHRVRYPEPSPP